MEGSCGYYLRVHWILHLLRAPGITSPTMGSKICIRSLTLLMNRHNTPSFVGGVCMDLRCHDPKARGNFSKCLVICTPHSQIYEACFHFCSYS